MRRKRLFVPAYICLLLPAALACSPAPEPVAGGGEDTQAAPAPAPAPVVRPLAPPPTSTPTARPGPVRDESNMTPAAGTPPAIQYFAHARFALARDEQVQPLGVRVEKILTGGRVALTGVEVGDIMMAINNVALNDPRTFDRAVRTAEELFIAGRPQQINVIRQGKRMGLIPMGTVKTTPVDSTQP